MALEPLDDIHALQIQAGTLGRRAGHEFEDKITEKINSLRYPIDITPLGGGNIFTGEPGSLLLSHIASCLHFKRVTAGTSISTGALATSEDGKKWLSINGADVSRCKSDLVVTLSSDHHQQVTVGVSTKQCNTKTPTNAQLYFTTARGFATLLTRNGIPVSDPAVHSLRQFCGDSGFRPIDNSSDLRGRRSDPRRYFWEEIRPDGRSEWERILSDHQDTISRLLFQKAYMNDPFVPEYLLHKTKLNRSWEDTEVAIFSIEELIRLSRLYQGFVTKPYSVKKGSHKDPIGVRHLAPRFGIIQMQRGGQKQHPEQLQFNLEAGYFYKI